MEIEYDYVVIGAGASGLAFSALMEKKGFNVALLEAHSLPGGCSSFFERDGFIFDAGATTLSGLKPGRPLFNLLKELELPLELIPIDPGIISVLSNKSVSHFKDIRLWKNELNKNFPNIDNDKLWNELKKIDDLGWDLSNSINELPIRSFKKIVSLLNLKLIKAIKALPYLFSSVDDKLKSLSISDPEYLRFIDELLFITAQNNRSDTPLLMGAMGLSYPDDTYYAQGGMKGFSEALAKKCSHVYYRNIVKEIHPIENGKNGFKIVTNKNIFIAKKLVSTIPVWNHTELFKDIKGQKFFEKYSAPKPEECWSAFMLYLTIPLDNNRESLYYQIHTDEIPFCKTHSFFVSLSHPLDGQRSKNKRQTVTISTHTKAQPWLKMTKDEYEQSKKICAEFILNVLKEKFNLADHDLENILTGSPKTFIRYTHRHHGLVGGLPHSLKRNPIDFLFAKSPYDNFFMLGDTQFPGQGIAAVVLGAQNLAASE